MIGYNDVPWDICNDGGQRTIICYNPGGCTPYFITGGQSRKSTPIFGSGWQAPTAAFMGYTSFVDVTGASCSRCTSANFKTVPQSTIVQPFGETYSGSFTISYPCGGTNDVPYVYTDGNLTFYVTWGCCETCSCDSSSYVCSHVSIAATYLSVHDQTVYGYQSQGSTCDDTNGIALYGQSGNIEWTHSQSINITLERNIYNTQLPYYELSPGAYTTMTGTADNDISQIYDFYGLWPGTYPCGTGPYHQDFTCNDISALQGAGWNLTVTAS